MEFTSTIFKGNLGCQVQPVQDLCELMWVLSCPTMYQYWHCSVSGVLLQISGCTFEGLQVYFLSKLYYKLMQSHKKLYPGVRKWEYVAGTRCVTFSKNVWHSV